MTNNQDANRHMILDLLDGVLRSWWTVVAGACLGAAVGIVVLQQLPKVYEAEVKLFLDAEKLPDKFVTKLVEDNTKIRMQSLVESVLESDELERRARDEFASGLTVEEQDAVLASIRRNVSIAFTRREPTFYVHYRDGDPIRASEIANALGDLFVEANADFRAGRATSNREVLERLAEQARLDLDDIERQITDFKKRHQYELPEHKDVNLEMLRNRNDDLERNLGHQKQLKDSIQNLESQQPYVGNVGSPSSATPGTAIGPAGSVSITALEAELEALLQNYQPDHPDVRRVQRAIEDAKRRDPQPEEPDIPEEAIDEAEDAPPLPTLDPFRMQLRAANRELEKLEAVQATIESDIREYERRVQATPLVQQQLEELSRGVEVKRKNYRQRQSDVEDAKGAEYVEEEKQGSQFEVIKRASVPGLPASPKPLMVLGGSVSVGLVLFVAPILARRFLFPVVHSEARLQSTIDVPVLVSIPTIMNGEILKKRRRGVVLNIVLSMMAIIILAAVVGLRLGNIL